MRRKVSKLWQIPSIRGALRVLLSNAGQYHRSRLLVQRRTSLTARLELAGTSDDKVRHVTSNARGHPPITKPGIEDGGDGLGTLRRVVKEASAAARRSPRQI